MAGAKGKSGPPGNFHGRVHGYYMLKAAINGPGLDKRTSLYRALTEKEAELISALGGDPSPQERAIISDTVKTLLFLGSIDHYLQGLKSIVRKGRVHPVVIERTRLADHMRVNLTTLGLKRITKTLTLDEVLSEPEGEGEGASDAAA